MRRWRSRSDTAREKKTVERIPGQGCAGLFLARCHGAHERSGTEVMASTPAGGLIGSVLGAQSAADAMKMSFCIMADLGGMVEIAVGRCLEKGFLVCVCQGVMFDGFDGFGSNLLHVAVNWNDSSGQHDSSARAHLERLPESLHRRLQRRLRAKSGNIDRKRS